MAASDPPFKLSASLTGHDDDVRAVAFPNPSLAISASRDGSVRLWRSIKSSPPPIFEATVSSQGGEFVNSVAFIPPTSEYIEGLVISGTRDGIIEVRKPGSLHTNNAERLLVGHGGNVCALDVSTDGSLILSGSWDGTARIWSVANWETIVTLEAHEGSVWAVLAFDSSTFITASADKHVRLFDISGRLLRKFQAGNDALRALVRLSSSHPSGAQFASAGNDATIRLWTTEGLDVAALRGHENFIYSLATLPSGELVSSSEDRTVRLWKGDTCVQTITHPAISVWSVAVCKESGDIVSGASDKTIRIFTRAPERVADVITMQAFENSVQASAIPQQSLGDLNKTDMPGPDFLQQRSGTKEGQVQLIKESSGSVIAYQWSTAGNQWVSVGMVVDAAGSGTKVSYLGEDYDYVFDVDIEDGKPPLKLPYNVSQNPYDAARKFIDDHDLPVGYLEEVANFIVKNSQGASLGTGSANSANGSRADPWGTESRYRPGDTSQASPTQSITPKVLPQKHYLGITTANFKILQKKIEEFNGQLLTEGRKDLVLGPAEVKMLADTMEQVESGVSKAQASTKLSPASITLTLRAATQWPSDKRLPWLDFFRLVVAASADSIGLSAEGTESLVDRLALAEVFAESSPINNAMMAIRILANLFRSPEGRNLASTQFDKIIALASPYKTTTNKNLLLAITTLYINFAVLLSVKSTDSAIEADQASRADRAITLLASLSEILAHSKEPEAIYRALVAAGTVLSLGKDFGELAKEALDIEQAIDTAERVAHEGRIKNVVKEIRDVLS